MEAPESVLVKHPFFHGLSSRHLEIIGECASRVNVSAGQYLFREQDEADQFYLITHGQVAVEVFKPSRGPITILTMGAGEALGWLWFEKPYHWHFDARALQLTRLIALDVKCLMHKCDKDAELGYALMKRYAHMLAAGFRTTVLQLVDMYGH